MTNFTNFFIKNIGFFLVLFLSNLFLNTLDFYLQHQGFHSSNELFLSDLLKYFKNFFSMLGICIMFVFIAYIFKKKFVLHIIFAINFLIFAVDLFLLLNFHSFFNQFMLDSFFRTNPQESIEFIKNYLDFSYIFILIFTFIILIFIYRLKSKITLWGGACKVLSIVFIFLICILIGDSIKKYYKTKLYSYTFLRFESFSISRFACAFLYYNERGFVDYLKLIDDYKKMYESKEKIKAKNDIKNIILILGESLNRYKMGIYGSQYDTTPNMMKLQKNGNLIAFNDVIAPYHSTNLVMQTILNFSNYENTSSKTPWSSYFDVISLFKLANYKTYFISNQESFGAWGNAAASIAMGSDEFYFSNQGKNSIRFMNFRPDGILLTYLDELLLKTNLNENNFFIIHLMGSHFIYDYRYEKEFKKFKKEDIKEQNDSKKQEEIAGYYNSVFYNDYIIKSIFDKFANNDTLIIYLSDHGESLYDDKSKSVAGHSIVDATNAEIPFLIMFSNDFKQKHPDILKKMQKSINKSYMSDDLIHTLCDIAGLEYYECKNERSVINDEFDSTRKRMFQGKDGVDYDEVLRKKQ